MRKFLKCNECFLIFLDPVLRLSSVVEKSRYAEHENNVEQEGYRNFLNQLWIPLNRQLKPNAVGLDYGCGPKPAMSSLAQNDGKILKSYDPYFYNQRALLMESYDFIVCSEAAEHFYQPGQEFETIQQCLKPEGILGVMTWFLEDEKKFPNWGYHHDQTHVCFYQPATIRWIAERWQWTYQIVSDRVVFFKKRA